MRHLRRADADCLLVRDLASIRYLTGCAFHSIGDALVLVSQRGVTLFTDGRYISVKRMLKNQPVGVVIWDRKDIPGAIFDVATYRRRTKMVIGFEQSHDAMSYGFVQSLRNAAQRTRWRSAVTIHALPDIMLPIRSIKTPAELRLMRRATARADRALQNILPHVKRGVTELDIARLLNIELRKLSGEDELSFATIVASGQNGDTPHATPGNRKIKRGDLVTIDYGLVYQGYHTDTTRTIIVGRLESRAQKLFDTVLAAQQTAQQAARPGMTGCDIDKIARDIILAAGYREKQFPHGTGHGVGLDIHEKPHITSSPKFGGVPLVPGMVFSIEPGIYDEGFTGCRLENTVVMTETGARSLSRLPMEIRVP